MDRPLALFCRYLWESRNITWVYTAHVDRLLASRRHYYASFGQEVPELGESVQREMDELMVASALASASQAERDVWGWTVRIPMKPWGIFCGVEPEGMVCSHFTQLGTEAANDPVGAIAVQRVQGTGPVRQTSLIPRDISARFIVEQYFDESEQLPARLAILGEEAVMALSMPDADWSVVDKLTDIDLMKLFHELRRNAGESALESAEGGEEVQGALAEMRKKFAALKAEPVGAMHGDLKFMYESVYYYGCRCSEERIREMLKNLPEAQQKELWGDLEELEVECPRCGLKHRIMKGA